MLRSLVWELVTEVLGQPVDFLSKGLIYNAMEASNHAMYIYQTKKQTHTHTQRRIYVHNLHRQIQLHVSANRISVIGLYT